MTGLAGSVKECILKKVGTEVEKIYGSYPVYCPFPTYSCNVSAVIQLFVYFTLNIM